MHARPTVHRRVRMALATVSILIARSAGAATECIACNESWGSVTYAYYSPGAREMALGGAGVAAADGPAAARYNPALIAWAGNRFATSATYYKVLQNFGLNDMYYAGAATVLRTPRWGAFAVDIAYLALGEQVRTDGFGRRVSDVSTYSTAVGIAYARKIGGKVSTGVTGRFFYDHLGDAGQGFERGTPTGTGYAFDMGVLWRPFARFSLGAALRDYGPDIQYIDQDQATALPVSFTIGAAGDPVRTADHRITLAADLFKPLATYGSCGSEPGGSWYLAPIRGWYDESVYRIETGKDQQGNTIEIPRRSIWREESRQVDILTGIEYAYRETILLRGGWFRDRDAEIDRLTYGAGFRIPLGSRAVFSGDAGRIEAIEGTGQTDPADGRWHLSAGIGF